MEQKTTLMSNKSEGTIKPNFADGFSLLKKCALVILKFSK